MNLKKIIPVFLIALASYVTCEEFKFTGYRLIRLFPKTQQQLDLIGKWENDDSEVFIQFKNF
jgi:hypothetical protein